MTKRLLAWSTNRLTSNSAEVVGMNNCCLFRGGMRVKIDVIEYDRYKVHEPTVVDDLPSGDRRLMQTTEDYVVTMVSGEIISRDGKATDALADRLVCGPRLGPLRML